MAQEVSTKPEDGGCYVYAPLEPNNSIRLINLEPATSRDAELTCTITAFSLDSAPPFEAISYVWGEPIVSDILSTPDGVVKITQSLAMALRHFRLESETRCVWADAVCINQADNDEKGYQVAQMGDIYKMASKVLAWLGEGTNKAYQAMRDCERLCSVAERYQVEEKDIDYDVFRGPRLKIKDDSGKEVTLMTWDVVSERGDSNLVRSILKDIQDSQIHTLVTFPWFSRLWVIQEVACSSSTLLHCGDQTMEWKVFASVMRLLIAIVNMPGPLRLLDVDNKDDIMTPDLKRAWNLVQLRDEYRTTNIGELFCLSTYRQFGGSVSKAVSHHCFDDRDRIYGLLSLSSELSKSRGIVVKPDYNKPTPEIYRDFALLYLLSNTSNSNYPRDARILSDAGLWQRSAESWDWSTQLDYMDSEYLPSWVPEYRPQNLSQDELPWRDAPFNTRWHTCPPGIQEITERDFMTKAPFALHKNILGVSGTLVDRVESLMIVQDQETAQKMQAGEMTAVGLSSLNADSGLETVFGCLNAARQMCGHIMPEDKYFTGEDVRAALVRTLLAECSHPELLNIMWNFPDCKDEAQMIALWEKFEKCCLHPDGELRLLVQQRHAAAEKWKEELRAKKQDGDSLFSSDCKDAIEFTRAAQWVLSRSKLVFSTRGLLALVPRAALQYDSIVQLQGTTMPFVVRGIGKTGLSCLVGPCYVHGLMHCPSFEHDFEVSRRGGLLCLV